MARYMAHALAVVVAMFFIAGCGVAENASYCPFSGSLVASEEPGTITELHKATVKALSDLELRITYDKKDNLVAVVEAMTAQGNAIKVLIDFRSVDVSYLAVDTENEKYKAAGVLNEIRKNMSAI